jgi:hypothetical protein
MITNNINGRKYIGADSNNNPSYFGSGVLIKQAIKKYGKENFTKTILEKCETVKDMYEKEIFWINKYNAVNDDIFYNLSEGGKGGNTLTNEITLNKWKNNTPNLVEINKLRKGKTYEEIYGEKSDVEKEKRKIASTGVVFSEERKHNMSESSKGKIAWNKGLTKETSESVIKYSLNSKSSISYRTYFLSIDSGDEIEIFGKKELEIFIKNYNSTLKFKSRINLDLLIQQGETKNFKIRFENGKREKEKT